MDIIRCLVLLMVTLLSGCASTVDYQATACNLVEAAVLTAEDYESLHPGQVELLPQRISEARVILDLFCSGEPITVEQLSDLREMGPILRQVLELMGQSSEQIESYLFGLSAVLNLVEAWQRDPATPRALVHGTSA